MTSIIRLQSSSPPTSPDGSTTDHSFSFTLAPVPPSPAGYGGGGGGSIPPPIPPSTRFQVQEMRMFGARPMEEGGREQGLWRCGGRAGKGGCGRVVMAGGLAGHEANCPNNARIDPNSGARRPGVATISGPGSGYKKGKNGLKRGESEVSQSPSETPTKKRINYSPSRSVGSVDTSYPLASTAASINGIDHAMTGMSGSQSNNNGKEKDKTVGVIDSDDGRMWLENGRKETKKQMSKRLAEERRVQKREELAERERIKAGVSTGQVTLTVPDLKLKKTGPKPIKEYEPDKHCGVPNAGTPCVRKLDCKIHTVGDKRNVTGRTMSFDDCLRVYKGEAPRGPDAPAGEPKAGSKKARRRPGHGMDDAARRKFGFLGLSGVGDAEQEEDWSAHPLAAVHEFAELLDCVRRENVLLEGLVRRRACDELTGRVVDEPSASPDPAAKGKKAATAAEPGTVPPPSQPETQIKVESTSTGSVDKPATQEPTLGGFDFLDVPPPPVPAPSQGTKSSTQPAVDETPAKAGAVASKSAALPTPTYGPNVLARETFAGGATTGSWHLDRRRMLGAEKCFGDILAQLQG
ncbi:hypothetical protein QFC21_000737 [Naganishia friedmannii]|uniref:Uncharacterized protein n=1 Tax=Naganishia friedmannii TaxID=89922 RepID=A0ACC2W6D0_9TREE|nr:hypothetical protein QFC21_000737 [Naganishia friedmannii]